MKGCEKFANFNIQGEKKWHLLVQNINLEI
jgi:hypothetical protein